MLNLNMLQGYGLENILIFTLLLQISFKVYNYTDTNFKDT